MRFFLVTALLLWATPVSAQTVCGNIDIADPARIECRLSKAAEDQRTADLASSRARSEVEKAIQDFSALMEIMGSAPAEPTPEPVEPPDPVEPTPDDPDPVPPTDPLPPVTEIPAPPAPSTWPDIAARCEHADVIANVRPQTELEPYRNWRVATADCGADIQARFYTDGDQIRVAFEYQKPSLWEDGAPRSYTATVLLDGAEVAREEIVDQVPYTRWSWRLKQPEVIRDRRELVAAGLFPPLGNNIRGGEFGFWGSYEPLGLAGFTPAMGMGGGRQEIGVVTSAQGEYIATGNPDALRTIFDQGDSLGSWPFVARDPKTGTPLRFDGDLIDAVYHKASGGSQEAKKIRVALPKATNMQGQVIDQKPDHAHLPSFSYVPWMLTGDPYYLEGLQFEMVWVVGRSQNVGFTSFPRVVHNEQMRSLSWSVRTVIQAALGVPEDTPNWLVPKSYYEWLSVGNAETIKTAYIDGDRSVLRWGGGWPETVQFGKWSGITSRKSPEAIIQDRDFRRWMVDFMALSVAHGVLGGLDEWRPVLDWQMKASVEGARHLRGLIATYSPDPSGVGGGLATSFADMAAAKEFLPEHTAGSGLPQVRYHNYWQYHHSVIRVAEHFGVPGAAEVSKWLYSQRNRDQYRGDFNFEFEFKAPPDVAPGLPLSDFLPKP